MFCSGFGVTASHPDCKTTHLGRCQFILRNAKYLNPRWMAYDNKGSVSEFTQSFASQKPPRSVCLCPGPSGGGRKEDEGESDLHVKFVLRIRAVPHAEAEQQRAAGAASQRHQSEFEL